MRLTLRTLLSYLDDTLEPAQAKAIGAKVAESEQARELMERIKQVTRRRRLTTPPQSGPGGIDANTIAEYLDNDVTPEQAAEVEQICLASDVHLAEVAACHQILTLVLGEPALVPPSAKQRMYGLVKGPESIPFRKPAKSAAKDDQDLSSEIEPDQDDTLRMGVPAAGRGIDNRNLWLIAGGSLLAVCLLVVAVWQLVHNTGPKKDDVQLAQDAKDKDKDKDKAGEKDADKNQGGKTNDAKKTPDDKDKGKPDDKPPIPVTPDDTKLPITVDPVPPNEKPADIPYQPANMKPGPIGRYRMPAAKEEPTVLLQKGDKAGWTRITGKNAPVSSGKPLVSLSGSKSIVALDGGIELTLWGNLPEATLDSTVLESRLIVHVNPQLDADLTLERGRVILRNKKPDGKDALVRLRFNSNAPKQTKDEFFDITLNGPDSAVIVDRVCVLDPNEPFYENPNDANRVGPTVIMKIFALESSASIRFGEPSETVDKAQKPMLQWQSRQGGLGVPPNSSLPPWIKGMPVLKDDRKLLRDIAVKSHLALAKNITEAKAVDVALAEVLQIVQQEKLSPDSFALWRHAIRCLEAVDDVSHIYDDFSQDRTPIFVRGQCLFNLQQWLAWDRDNDYQLLKVVRKNNDSKTVSIKIMELFHPVIPKDRADPATYQLLIEGLDNELLPIRTLSHWQLLGLVPPGGEIFYDPAMPRQQRLAAIARWRSLIPAGKMPLSKLPPLKK